MNEPNDGCRVRLIKEEHNKVGEQARRQEVEGMFASEPKQLRVCFFANG
jgi:hypothetical protein